MYYCVVYWPCVCLLHSSYLLIDANFFSVQVSASSAPTVELDWATNVVLKTWREKEMAVILTSGCHSDEHACRLLWNIFFVRSEKFTFCQSSYPVTPLTFVNLTDRFVSFTATTLTFVNLTSRFLSFTATTLTFVNLTDRFLSFTATTLTFVTLTDRFLSFTATRLTFVTLTDRFISFTATALTFVNLTGRFLPFTATTLTFCNVNYRFPSFTANEPINWLVSHHVAVLPHVMWKQFQRN